MFPIELVNCIAEFTDVHTTARISVTCRYMLAQRREFLKTYGVFMQTLQAVKRLKHTVNNGLSMLESKNKSVIYGVFTGDNVYETHVITVYHNDLNKKYIIVEDYLHVDLGDCYMKSELWDGNDTIGYNQCNIIAFMLKCLVLIKH